jgi:hypothetical protein
MGIGSCSEYEAAFSLKIFFCKGKNLLFSAFYENNKRFLLNIFIWHG